MLIAHEFSPSKKKITTVIAGPKPLLTTFEKLPSLLYLPLLLPVPLFVIP